MLKLSLSMKKWVFNARDLQARSLFSWFSRGFFVSANCERRNAENMMTHPRISRPVMTSWRKIPPHKAAKTDSMLMIMAASAGGVYFCPTICSVTECFCFCWLYYLSRTVIKAITNSAKADVTVFLLYNSKNALTRRHTNGNPTTSGAFV